MVRCRLRRTFKGPTDSPRSKPTQPAQRARSSRQAKTPRLRSEIGDQVSGRDILQGLLETLLLLLRFEINRERTLFQMILTNEIATSAIRDRTRIYLKTKATTCH